MLLQRLNKLVTMNIDKRKDPRYYMEMAVEVMRNLFRKEAKPIRAPLLELSWFFLKGK